MAIWDFQARAGKIRLSKSNKEKRDLLLLTFNVQNPWTWVNLTNMVWVEQPVGTGFSQGQANAVTEEDVAHQFLGFFQNFVDLFNLQNRTVYLAGESYAGMYIPYIADAMFRAKDPMYYGLEATMMYDPLLNNNNVMRQIPAVAYAEYWNNLLGLNESFMSTMRGRADTCGYATFLETGLVYPPSGPLPSPSVGVEDVQGDCDVWDAVISAATLINPVRHLRYLTLISL